MTMNEQHSEHLACFIVGRNLGDAVIQSGFIKALAARGYARRYLVWTRPQVAFLFADIQDCDVICSQFPVGTTKEFGGAAAVRFLRTAWEIHRRDPSITLDLIGDIRERLFARLTGSSRHLHIGWAVDHPFARLIRNPFGQGRPIAVVPASIPNVYDAYERMLDVLAPVTSASESLPKAASFSLRSGKLRVGLHPFASQAYSHWPSERWQRLVHRLLERDFQLTVFGAPSERTKLQRIFSPYIDRLIVFTEPLKSFLNEVANQDLLIGLNSFSVHVAHRQGVCSIMINAGNHPGIWGPPSCTVLAGSGGCSQYPCYNAAPCQGKLNENLCIKSISSDQVLTVIYGLMNKKESSGGIR